MKYEYEYESRTHEINSIGGIKPTQLIQYMQDVAERQICANDMDYVEMVNDKHLAFIISRMNVEIYSPIPRYATLRARTWVTEGRAANFPRYYDLWHGDNLVARAASNWALVNTETKRIVKYKDYDTSQYAFDKALELEIPTRFRLPQDIELTEVEGFEVGYSMTDINKHMNNAMYINRLYDRIPGVEDCELTSINIRYLREAPYKANVKVYRSDFLDPGEIDKRADKIIYFFTETAGETNVEAAFGVKRVK